MDILLEAIQAMEDPLSERHRSWTMSSDISE